MQHNEQRGILTRRRATLSVFLRLLDSEWTLHSKLAVAFEIRRIREQIHLQNAARCRVWASAFNINALSDRECLISRLGYFRDIPKFPKLLTFEIFTGCRIGIFGSPRFGDVCIGSADRESEHTLVEW
jgi:hypothetical protein